MKYTLLLLVFFTFIFSCKKEKNEEPVVSSPPAQTDTTATDSIPADTLVVMSDSCYGLFYSQRSYTLLANNSLQPIVPIKPVALFDSIPHHYTTGPMYPIYIDSITCNGINMVYNGYNYEADPSFNGNLTLPLTWHVKGDSHVQGFDYTVTDTYPFYAGYLAMPDTINIHQPFQMTLTGLTGQNWVYVFLGDHAIPMHNIHKAYKTDSSQVTILLSQSELSQLDPQLPGVLSVEVRRNNLQIFHGKQFDFSASSVITTAVDLR